MNSYYYIGHFSKFIRPGARRVTSSSSRVQLLTTAFINTDGKLAVVVMNPDSRKISYRLYIGSQAVETISLPHSITTMMVQ
jgi:glucosylceramidase